MLDIKNIFDLKGRYFGDGKWLITNIFDSFDDKEGSENKGQPYYNFKIKPHKYGTETISEFRIYKPPLINIDGSVLGYRGHLYYKNYETLIFSGYIPPETIKDPVLLFDKIAKLLNEEHNKK